MKQKTEWVIPETMTYQELIKVNYYLRHGTLWCRASADMRWVNCWGGVVGNLNLFRVDDCPAGLILGDPDVDLRWVNFMKPRAEDFNSKFVVVIGD